MHGHTFIYFRLTGKRYHSHMAGVYCIVICKNAAGRAFSFFCSFSLLCLLRFLLLLLFLPLFLLVLCLLLLLLFCSLPPCRKQCGKTFPKRVGKGFPKKKRSSLIVTVFYYYTAFPFI